MTNLDHLERPPLLLTELRRFIRLRWLAGLVVVLGTLVGSLWKDWLDHPQRILTVGSVILIYNAVFWVILKSDESTNTKDAKLITIAWMQLLFDIACLTLLVIWTGGISSPLLFLFVLHMVFASLLLKPQTSYLAPAAAIVMVVVGLWLTGQWPIEPSQARSSLGWMLALLATVYLTNHISKGLRDNEEILRKQTRRTEDILRTAVDGIITIDEKGTIQSFNPAAQEIFGYDQQQVLGNNIKMLMPEPNRGQHDSYLTNYLDTGERKIIDIGREVLGTRSDGSTFPLEIAVSEVLIGQQRTYTGIVRDITERKEAETQLKKLNKELVRQQETLVHNEKMAAMGQMAAGIAHEISNPLAGMDSLLQLIERYPDRFGPETIENLRKQLARTNKIVKQMTAFAHPVESGWETIALNDVVQSALDVVRFDSRQKGVEIVSELSSEIGSLRVMPHALQQVLVNLIVNAFDAVAETDEPRIMVKTFREGNWCVIEITDNGHGIKAENITRVFEPFFTTKPVGQGTGLGLSISYNLIKQHNGRCDVRSERGDGTTFSIFLPTTASPNIPSTGTT